MTDTSNRQAGPPADRRAQFLERIRAQAEGAARRGPAPRRDSGPAPLSHAQETLWFLSRLAPDTPTYNVPMCTRIQGDLDVAALRAALATVVARHDALRTAIVEREDGPVQVIAPQVAVELPVLKAEGADHAQRLAAGRALVAERIRSPFDLSRLPLWRAVLIEVAPDDHLFLFDVHHIVFDGWSLGVLTSEIAEVYRATKAGDEPQLDKLTVQYPDYAVWQREWLDGGELDKLSAYWREKLAGTEVLEFPTDRPRGDALTFDGSFRGFQVGGKSLARARELARQEGATAFTAYLAAFFVLLRRYSGLDDLVIGSPNANRRHDSVAPVIGFFINMMVLRGDLSGDPSFRELVRRLKPVVLDAYAHGDLPFNKLVDAVNPPRDPSRSPIFQIAFTLQNAAKAAGLPGLAMDDEPVHVGTSRFDMSWNLADPGSGDEDARLEIEFNSDLFDAESIARFARHYDELLANLTAKPDAPLSAAGMLTAEERAFLAETATGPVRAVRETTIVEQFEQRVAEAPDSVALVVEEVEYSYAELNARANRLAALLREHGAGPGANVGLCLRRTADLTTAIMAVLKTGAAYVPLDPTHPPARVADIASDAALAVVVAQTATVGVLAETKAPAVVVDEDDTREQIGKYPEENPPLAAAPDDVAYIIYTSGSTGRPKGVVLGHRGVVNFTDSTRELFEMTKADRVLGFASATFDVSVFETFSALLTGARLYLATDDERVSIDRLQVLMERSGITVIDLPPTVMPLLAPEKFTGLRIAFVGGEAFSGELVNRWNPGRRLFNGYGPTECTVTMIVEECPGTWESSPPIGLPMTNHVAHVLDRDLAQVPVGVPGELVIGGAGLAKGYLNRPELTAEKFVADPFGSAPDGRLYHSGDLVKRLPDGRLVFLGRLDQQVKIRGLRIELGEVESALAAYAGIEQVTVQPWTDDHGDKHLVGYITGVRDDDLSAVRDHLGQRLPSYMIPSYFVVLDEIPLTASGKVDWRRLPAPDPDAAGSGGPEGEPRSETERILLREVVGPMLRTERLGVHDDFFRAGGNSLQAAQLMSAINRRFGVEVALADFFASPTVAHLAVIVDTVRASRLSDQELMEMLENLSDEEVERLLGTSGDER